MTVKHGKTKYIIILSLCFISCMLTGCTTIFSNPKGLDEVEERLAEASPNESFTFQEVERRSGLPKRDTYYFVSDERDFTIKVYSAVAQDNLQGIDLPLYYKYIYINYPGVVRQLYYDDAVSMIEASDLYVPKATGEWTIEDLEYLSDAPWRTFIIDNPGDIEEVVSIIAKLYELYSEEIKYNGEEWTKENPLIDMSVYWGDEEAREEHHCVFLATFHVDGTASYDEVDEQLRNAYKEKMEEGLIP